MIGIIKIEASSSQFDYLQKFVNGEGSIREVDRILGSAIKESGLFMYRYMAEISYYFNILSEYFMYNASLMMERVRTNICTYIHIYIFFFNVIY